MKKLVTYLALIVIPGMAGIALANEFTVGQKDKKFTETELTISVGDTVNFRNDDPFSHNIYSLSEVKSFDLGSYPKGDSRAVTFDQPGEVEVGCAIHFDMAMIITIE